MRFMFLFLVCSLFCSTLKGQKQKGDFIVFTFAENYKDSGHETQYYNWVVHLDSLKKYGSRLAEGVLFGFSKDNLQDCCSGIPTDPFLVTKNSDYDLEDVSFQRQEELKKLLVQHKKKIQVIRSKRLASNKKKVKVFLVAVHGEFCFCNFHPIGRERDNYHGQIAIPCSDFKVIEDFWVLHRVNIFIPDFSNFRYNIKN